MENVFAKRNGIENEYLEGERAEYINGTVGRRNLFGKNIKTELGKRM